MKGVEKTQDRFDVARERFVVGVEEIVTEKNWSKSWGDPDEIVTKLRNKQKIEWHDWLYGRAVMIGQQLRLTPDEIDDFLATIFESDKSQEYKDFDQNKL